MAGTRRTARKSYSSSRQYPPKRSTVQRNYRSTSWDTSQKNEELTPEKILMIVIGIITGIIMGLAKMNTGEHYEAGSGSSHQGGHYVNYATDNHYSKH